MKFEVVIIQSLHVELFLGKVKKQVVLLLALKIFTIFLCLLNISAQATNSENSIAVGLLASRQDTPSGGDVRTLIHNKTRGPLAREGPPGSQQIYDVIVLYRGRFAVDETIG